MPKEYSHHDLVSLVATIARTSSGTSLDEIAKLLGASVPRRTLQRRLSLLSLQNRIVREGRGRATRYRVPSPAFELASVMETPEDTYSALPVSPEGRAIRNAIRAEIHEREPVGYNRSFLDGYRPNETAYLPPSLRRHLAEIASTPGEKLPAGTHARMVFNRLLIDLSWNSSRLEGNTYSLLETERLLELGQSAVGKDARDAQMILNHKAAIELLVGQADEIRFNRYTVLNLHALLAENLLSDPLAAGRLRSIPVAIGGTVFHPLQGPQMIDECFNQILATATAIKNPFEQAFFVMVQFPYLQPFEDVNKRVSRLAANIPLIRRNLCPLSFVDVPARDYIDGILGVYELNKVELFRDVFVWAYERSCARYAAVKRSLGDPDPFRTRYRQALSEVVEAIIRGVMDRSAAVHFIQEEAKERAPDGERARLVELIETEVMSLHEGNFARYHVRPSEYGKWRKGWR